MACKITNTGVPIPWWSKVGAKIVLSRLPLKHSLWQRLRIFRHGRMDEPDYVRAIFDRNVSWAALNGKLKGRNVLELGPGNIALALRCSLRAMVQVRSWWILVTERHVKSSLTKTLRNHC